MYKNSAFKDGGFNVYVPNLTNEEQKSLVSAVMKNTHSVQRACSPDWREVIQGTEEFCIGYCTAANHAVESHGGYHCRVVPFGLSSKEQDEAAVKYGLDETAEDD